jgi:GH15 family glucan-1,4-alpha-glucosidase
LALSGRVEDAWDRFDRHTKYATTVRLIAEELDPVANAHLGTFPQAFSHIGSINSVLYLGYADLRAAGPPPMGIRLGNPNGLEGE